MLYKPSETNWQILLSLFPVNWKRLAKEKGAFVRKLRSFPSEEAMIRTLMLHLSKGYSLRETVVKAKLAGIANVSDVALLKRLRLSEAFFKSLCEEMLIERGMKKIPVPNGIQIKLVDGTNIKEPGKTGGLWRIHYSLKLPTLQCNYFKLTKTKGVGTGESFKHYPINKYDCIIGDRGYSTGPGIEYIDKHDAYVIVRVNTQALVLFDHNKNAFNLLHNVTSLKKEWQSNQWDTYIKKEDGQNYIKGRICAVRKSDVAIEQAIKQLKRTASRDRTNLMPQTIQFAKYIIIFTTAPQEHFSLSSVLEWYRLRWQIELIFKRLKSLSGLGHLPKHNSSSSRAWIYGKLFTGLLVEKVICHADAISPWNYRLG